MEFDIERQIENIPIENTKKQFTAVFQLYAIGNYRACVVMLWSCIVCDLLNKLNLSVVLHEDTIAKSILEDVDRNRTGDNFRVDWEITFVEELKKRTKFFSDIAYKQIREIQQHRHWCAHPTFNDNYDLYEPSKDLCRDHMLLALQNVLLRPSFMTKQLTELVLTSLSYIREYNYDETTVGRFLEEKYLKNIPEDLRNKLFRDMWHIVFATEEDGDATRNRTLGMWVIKYLLNKDSSLLSLLDSENVYYSKISYKTDVLETFLSFISFFPTIWSKLTDSCKTLLKSEIQKHDVLNFLGVCLDDNLQIHFERLQTEPFYLDDGSFGGQRRYAGLKKSHIDVMFKITQENSGARNALCRFLIKMHTSSVSYDIADITFEQVVSPYLLEFSKENIEFLLDEINNNSQCRDRRENKSALREIQQVCLKNNIEIKPERYPYISGIAMFSQAK